MKCVKCKNVICSKCYKNEVYTISGKKYCSLNCYYESLQPKKGTKK